MIQDIAIDAERPSQSETHPIVVGLYAIGGAVFFLALGALVAICWLAVA